MISPAAGSDRSSVRRPSCAEASEGKQKEESARNRRGSGLGQGRQVGIRKKMAEINEKGAGDNGYCEGWR